MKSTIPSLAPLFPLLEIKSFKDNHGVLRYPFNQSFSRCVAEIPCPPCTLALQPFDGSDNRTCVLTRCLVLSKPPLKAFYCLRGTLILDSSTQTSNKQNIIIRIDGYNGIRFIQINANRMNGLSFLSFNLKADIADELAPLDLNIDAINTDSLLKYCLKQSGTL